MFVANATVSLMRGDAAENEYGSVTQSTHTVATGIRALITSTPRTVVSRETGRSFVVNLASGLLDYDQDVLENDRLVVDGNGHIYEVQGADESDEQGPFRRFPKTLVLRRIEA